MAHPEWVRKYKLPNTEIRCIRGKYSLYNITSVWCPEKKRNKKKTLKQVGIITEDFGLIPTGMSRKGRVPQGGSKIKEEASLEANFSDKFESVKDPRSTRNQLYTVSEINLITFLAVLCGAEGWRDVENYGKTKLPYLRRYFAYKNGTPSDDTLRRFYRSIDPERFKQLFCEWVKCLAATIDAQVIAVDGKSSRRSRDGDGNPLHVVSAFATEARIVLGQEKIATKSNEITAIPKLLDMLDIRGHIVTIDAMGCQHAIADKIISRNGDYIFALKGNQSSLQKAVKLCFVKSRKAKWVTHTDYDKGHGRIETRECTVCGDVKKLTERQPNWQSIKSVIKITSKREFKDTVTEETRYYISSLNSSPRETLKAVRSHWGIENSLHWILDMSFNEDYSRIRKGNAPHVMAIIRHFALNLLQKHKPPNQSVRGFRKICSWDDDTLTKLVSKHDFS